MSLQQLNSKMLQQQSKGQYVAANAEQNSKGNAPSGNDHRKHLPSKSYLMGSSQDDNGGAQQMQQQMDGQMIGSGGHHAQASGGGQYPVNLQQYAGGKLLSRSNTVDGQVQPPQDGVDTSGQGWQSNPAHGVSVGQRSNRPAMYVSPLSPLNNGWDQQQMLSNSKSTAGQVLGVKRITANNSNKAKVVVGQAIGANQSMDQSLSMQISNQQRQQNRDGNARAQSGDPIPEQASPHLKQKDGAGQRNMSDQISNQLNRLPSGAGSRNNQQIIHGRHLSHAQTLNQHQNQGLQASFDPMSGLQGNVINRQRMSNVPAQTMSHGMNHQGSQNFPVVMRTSQMLDQKRGTVASQSIDQRTQNRLASSKAFQMRQGNVGHPADPDNSQAPGSQPLGTAGNRKLSGDSNRLRNNRFRNMYNPQNQDGHDGVMSGQLTHEPISKEPGSAVHYSQKAYGGKSPLMMSGQKQTTKKQQQQPLQQPQIFSQQQLDQYKQQMHGSAKDDYQQMSTTIDCAFPNSSNINLPNNNMRGSRQRNHALMKPQPATEILNPHQQNSLNSQQLRQQIGQKWNNFSKNQQRGPIVPIDKKAAMTQGTGTTMMSGGTGDPKMAKFNSVQNPAQVAIRLDSSQKRDASARSHKSGMSDVMSNNSKRAQQQAQQSIEPNMMLAADQIQNRRPSRNGGLNNQSKTDQMINKQSNVQNSTDQNGGNNKDMKRFSSPLTKTQMPLRTYIQNSDAHKQMANTSKQQQRQGQGQSQMKYGNVLTAQQRMQGMVGGNQTTTLQQGRDLDKVAFKGDQTHQSDSILRPSEKRKNSQPSMRQSSGGVRPASSSNQNQQKTTMGSSGHAMKASITSQPKQQPMQGNASRHNLQSRHSRNKTNQQRTRTEIDPGQMRQFMADQSGSGNMMARDGNQSSQLRHDQQKSSNSQGYFKKASHSNTTKMNYIQQQQDQLQQQQQAANGAKMMDKLSNNNNNQQLTNVAPIVQNQRKPFIQKRNNSQDQQLLQQQQQKRPDSKMGQHKKGQSVHIGSQQHQSSQDGGSSFVDAGFGQNGGKQQQQYPSHNRAESLTNPSTQQKYGAASNHQRQNHQLNLDSFFSQKQQQQSDYQSSQPQAQQQTTGNDGSTELDNNSRPPNNNMIPRPQNKAAPPKSRNPHPGLQQQSINKAAFLSNKEQVAKIGGQIDQQYIKQPTTSTPNSTLNTSREMVTTNDSFSAIEGASGGGGDMIQASNKQAPDGSANSKASGENGTSGAPSQGTTDISEGQQKEQSAENNKRSEQQIKETIQNQRSLPDKSGNFCKIILEIEREGQQQYINFKNGHNPILNIIEAQLKGLIQGSNFLGGLGSGNDSDQNILYNPLKDFEEAKYASKSHGLITSYSANTHQGIQRNYNEDRVSIILNMTRPPNKDAATWPKCSFFAIYDGHGGSNCADFLKDHLHQIIIGQNCFPKDPRKALTDGCRIAEERFLKLAMKDPEIDKSGSCAIIVLTVETECYVANVGDSRAIMSAENGLRVYELSQDHRPNEEDEFYRIQDHGGQVYQTQTYQTIPITNQFGQVTGQSRQMLYGPYRVLPGRLSVSRTFGDIEAKDESLGGKKGVVIAEPEISQFTIDEDKHDFIVLGCDGIFDRLTSVNCLDSSWAAMSQAIKSQKEHSKKAPMTIHQVTGKMADAILRSSAIEKSYDNLTIVIVAFKNLNTFYQKAKQQNRKSFLNISVQNESEQK